MGTSCRSVDNFVYNFVVVISTKNHLYCFLHYPPGTESVFVFITGLEETLVFFLIKKDLIKTME